MRIPQKRVMELMKKRYEDIQIGSELDLMEEDNE